MRRPTSAWTTAILGTALTASTLSAQQAPTAAPAFGSGGGQAMTAVPDPSVPPSMRRGARHSLRNGWDFFKLRQYDRALALFHEAEKQKSELSQDELRSLREGLDSASQAVRESAVAGRAKVPARRVMAAAPTPADNTVQRASTKQGAGQSAAPLPAPLPAAAASVALSQAPVPAPVPTIPAPQPAPMPAAAAPAVAAAPPAAIVLETVQAPPAAAPSVATAPPAAALPDPEPLPVATAPETKPLPAASVAPVEPAATPSAATDSSTVALPSLSHEPERPSAREPEQPPAAAPAETSTPAAGLPAAEIDTLPPLPDTPPLPVAPPVAPPATDRDTVQTAQTTERAAPVPVPEPVPPVPDTLPGTSEAAPAPSTSNPPVVAAPNIPPATSAPETETPPATATPDVPRIAAAPDTAAPAAVPEPAPAPMTIPSLTPEPAVGPPPAPPAETLSQPTSAAPAEATAAEPATRPFGIPESTLSPELRRQVDEIALQQEEEAKRRAQQPQARPTTETAPTPGSPASRLELTRAPSPTEARPLHAIPVPEEFVPLPKRQWAPNRKMWAAAGTAHYPLYFQDASLERYGHSTEQFFGPIGRCLSYPLDDPRQSNQRNQLTQWIFSYGLFCAQIAALPYNLVMDPPWECEYDLGYYRPGDRIPTDIFYLPLTGIGPPLRGSNY